MHLPLSPRPAQRTGADGGWALVVPVKQLALAKTRLGPLAGSLRASLALAFATDTVRAALACSSVAGVVVVTAEARAARRVAALGALVVPEESGGGLNAALRHGAVHARGAFPERGVAALVADLPALRPAELDEALALARVHPRAVVPDSTGTGTTLLTARTGSSLQPAFGPGSHAAHLQAGSAEILGPGLGSLRRDVDTEDDLRAALALGVGPDTAAVAARLRWRH
ncbi:MAG: 2-phospho-L-lactate guanylyltransferase [Actinomycetota bacterium]|nr:2-phospho-L-lactate guanylyltransferase [Actinomycetota bacterium]